MDNEKLVENIKRLCKEHGTNISNLEKTLSFGNGTISRWVRSDPSLSKVDDIAHYFNITLDEVVGYQYEIDDIFLNILSEKTTSNDIVWIEYHENSEDPRKDLLQTLKTSQAKKNTSTKNVLYYVEYNDGYIYIYAEYYTYRGIKEPQVLKLFIQSDMNSKMILQKYSIEQLKSLWLKILHSDNANISDERKTIEFKKSFISSYESEVGKAYSRIRKVCVIDENERREGMKSLKDLFGSSPDVIIYKPDPSDED